jgi:hypothetical protein
MIGASGRPSAAVNCRLLGQQAQTKGRVMGRRDRRTAWLAALAIGIIGAAWASALAGAYTTATGAQRAAILGVAHAKWRSQVPTPCPADVGGPTVFHMYWARVSSIDPLYAMASVKDDGCTYTIGYVLSRPTMHSNRWRVAAVLHDSAEFCSDFHSVPGAVLNEFSIEGAIRGAGGGLRLCGRTTGAPWCDQFGVAYAVNTSCAVEQRVSRLYGSDCIPNAYRGGKLPPCRRSLDGFLCTPSGDVYAVVNCVDGRRRVGLHLAE